MSDLLYWTLAHGDKVLMWALVGLGGLISRLVLSHLKAGTMRDVVGRALAEVGDSVLAVTQTYVNDLKAASADGTLTDAERAEAKAKAVAVAKANLGPDGLKKLTKILGIDVDLDHWLGTKVEAAVAAAKLTTKPPAANPQ